MEGPESFSKRELEVLKFRAKSAANKESAA